MGNLVQTQNTAGFQGSERTGVEVRFYPQGGDPLLVAQESFKPEGRLRYDEFPALIAASYQNQLGAPSASWSITLKEGKRHHVKSLFNDLSDDDWVDFSFFKFRKRWHVLRGLIDDIRRSRQAGLGTATTTAWTVSGRSFGAVWEKTPIWFNVYTDENVGGAVSQKVFQSGENILGPPPVAVDGYLRGFLEELGDVGRANWVMPSGMPGGQGRFTRTVEINFLGYSDDPPLTAINNNWLMPQGDTWSLAKEWSDPMFNELIPDLYASADPRPDFNIQPGRELTVNDTKMYVIIRDRPFPRSGVASSPWFDLPMWILPRQAVVSSDVGKSGMERYNAYFVSPQLVQEILPEAGLDLVAPLWDRDDILKHGLRRFDIVSKYTSPEADLVGISTAQREKIRDWYCLNPYFLSGTIQLAVGLPDIRVGTKVRILGANGPDQDETYYVESVSHNWSFGVGLKTTLGVTRGWIGTDDSLKNALNEVAGRYRTEVLASPVEYEPPSFGFSPTE